MQIINKSGIPDVIHQYLIHDNYDYEAKGNSFSATELLKPIQEILLTRRHDKEIEVDSADRIWSLFGSAVHSVIEKGNLSEQQEERLSAEIDNIKVSGKFDLVKDNRIYDFKCTSAWTLVFGSRKDEWIKQLSIYRWLYKQNKQIELSHEGRIVAILRDWAARDKEKNNYPQSPIVEIPLRLIPISDTYKMIADKLKLIVASVKSPDNELPECTKEERWWNEKKKVYNKCEKYCVCCNFCHQVKKEKESKKCLK